MRGRDRAKVAVRTALHRAGLDLVRSLEPSDLLRRRMDLIGSHGIGVLFDVGANAGQYATTLRALGYQGRIVSFEPAGEAFRLLARAAAHDSDWTAVNLGLGEGEGEATLHVSANSQSSSLLDMLPAHVAAAPESAYVRRESVGLTTLASAVDAYTRPDDRLFVKIDTQGSERQVLRGGASKLDRVTGLQLELSMVPLYEGQPLMEEMVVELRGLGFVPMSLEPDFFHPQTGQLLQADGVFFREDPPRPAADQARTAGHP